MTEKSSLPSNPKPPLRNEYHKPRTLRASQRWPWRDLNALAMSCPAQPSNVRALANVNPEGMAKANLALCRLSVDIKTDNDQNSMLRRARSTAQSTAQDALDTDFLAPITKPIASRIVWMSDFALSGPGDVEQRKKLEATADKQFPQRPTFLLTLLAIYHAEVGNFDQADYMFAELLHRDPDFQLWKEGQIYHWAAYVALKRGEYVRALNFIKRGEGKRPAKSATVPGMDELRAQAKLGLATLLNTPP